MRNLTKGVAVVFVAIAALCIGPTQAAIDTQETETYTLDQSIAHSGGTDRNGCHHNRKTGGYHCH